MESSDCPVWAKKRVGYDTNVSLHPNGLNRSVFLATVLLFVSKKGLLQIMQLNVKNRIKRMYIEQKNRTPVGRFLTGMGLGMTLTIPNVYIVEVTDPQYRGVLGVLPNLFCQLGIFVTYVIGQWLDWSQLAFACMSFLFISLILRQ